MTTARTYSNRSNARRAGLAFGIQSDLLIVTVHKAGKSVRFGFCEKAASSTAETFVEREEILGVAAPEVKNGVRRRSGQGACARVWAHLDAHPESTVRQVREVALEAGWNLNNAVCEFYSWRRYHGVGKRIDPKKG